MTRNLYRAISSLLCTSLHLLCDLLLLQIQNCIHLPLAMQFHPTQLLHNSMLHNTTSTASRIHIQVFFHNTFVEFTLASIDCMRQPMTTADRDGVATALPPPTSELTCLAEVQELTIANLELSLFLTSCTAT